MKIEFYGVYRLSIGKKTVDVELPYDATIFDAIQEIARRFPNLQNEMFDQSGNLYPYQPLYINGRNPRLLEGGLHTVIKPDDVLCIFSPISSGRINVENVNKCQRD